MKSLNKVALLGRLGKDPELKYTPNGSAVCNFSLATSETFKDGNGGIKETTEWHNIVIWNKLAEVAGKYLNKGSLCYLEGKIKTRSWENNGEKKYITEIVADNLILLNSNQNQNDNQNETFSYPPENKEIPF